MKKCHPNGGAPPRWSLAGASDRPAAIAATPAEERRVLDPEVLPPESFGGLDEENLENRPNRKEQVRVEPPPAGPEGLRISREILDANLGPGDLEAIRVALNGKIQARRAVELARAQASIRVGMRVTYPGRHGPVEGVVHDVRRTRAVVCSDGDSWMVPLGLLRPVDEAQEGSATAHG